MPNVVAFVLLNVMVANCRVQLPLPPHPALMDTLILNLTPD